MRKEQITTKYKPFINELEKLFEGQRQGAVRTIDVGPRIYPMSIPPQLEIVVLDPAEKTICFRLVSAPDAILKRKGAWKIGEAVDAVEHVVSWSDRMKQFAEQDIPA